MEAHSDYQRLHGSDAPPTVLSTLQAGPVTALLDGIDLRYVRVGTIEVVRRLYVAVRDQHWNTIPAQTSNLRVEARPDSFIVAFEARHRDGPLDFHWRGQIEGTAHGIIRYEIDGTAGSDFRYNRIGLCVLHPMRECAGRPFRGETPSGPISGRLPALIGPQRSVNGRLQALFPSVNMLTIDLDGDVAGRFDFQGDLFEMEDQRNWTDASFKTYSTPIAMGFPHTATTGQVIRQSVGFSLHVGVPPVAPEDAPPRLTLGSRTGRRLPAIGYGMSSTEAPLTVREANLLRATRPDHLRVDLRLAPPDWTVPLEQALDASAKLDCALEAALHISIGADDQLADLAARLRGRSRVVRFLIYNADARTGEPSETTSAELMELARRHLGGAAPDATFAGGSDMNFCELNRTRPDAVAMDAICYAINPQVHAFDDLSLVETIEAQAETVRSAQALAPGTPIVVSPVTLRQRFNPFARTTEAGQRPDRLPSSVDPRQASLLGAAWTVGSIKALSESGVAAVTYYETTGWRGLLEAESGAPLPELFPSQPGMAFPLYHVFADLAEWKTGTLVELESNRPLAVTGLAVDHGGSLHVLVANLTGDAQEVTIEPLAAREALVRMLNAATVEQATQEPEQFRHSGQRIEIPEGLLVLELPPYTSARVDA